LGALMSVGSNMAIITLGNGAIKRYTNDSLFRIISKNLSLIKEKMNKGTKFKKAGRKLFVAVSLFVNFRSSL
jgi:hypothetical protein